MNANDTQPLTADQVPTRLYTEERPEPYVLQHMHGPFTFLLNQNHNALRGCTTCGAAWVGLMAGDAEQLVWHPIGELPDDSA